MIQESKKEEDKYLSGAREKLWRKALFIFDFAKENINLFGWPEIYRVFDGISIPYSVFCEVINNTSTENEKRIQLLEILSAQLVGDLNFYDKPDFEKLMEKIGDLKDEYLAAMWVLVLKNCDQVHLEKLRSSLVPQGQIVGRITRTIQERYEIEVNSKDDFDKSLARQICYNISGVKKPLFSHLLWSFVNSKNVDRHSGARLLLNKNCPAELRIKIIERIVSEWSEIANDNLCFSNFVELVPLIDDCSSLTQDQKIDFWKKNIYHFQRLSVERAKDEHFVGYWSSDEINAFRKAPPWVKEVLVRAGIVKEIDLIPNQKEIGDLVDSVLKELKK